MPSSLTMLLPLILGPSPHPPVSVCGTGAPGLDSGFSSQRGTACFGTCISLPVTPQAHAARISLHGALGRLDRLFQRPAHAILLRPHFSQAAVGGARISTRCPSPTPFGLGLGPDLPWEDEPCPGTLGFSMVKILTSLSLLIPAFSLPCRPRLLTMALLPTAARSPTTRIIRYASIASVYGFRPGNLRRGPT